MSVMFTFYIFLSALHFIVECHQAASTIPSCSKDSNLVLCSGIDNPDNLRKSLYKLLKSEFSSQTKNVGMLQIFKSYFSHIPHDLFVIPHDDVNVYNIMIRNTTLMSFSDTNTAFEGVEKSLKNFHVFDSVLLWDLDWRQLRKMTALEFIELNNIGLEYISSDVDTIPSNNLKKLSLEHNRVSYISDRAFAKFFNLLFLHLNNNHISKLKRSMFPNQVAFLDLSSNKISSLPSDLFTSMPNLKNVFLNENSLQTLDQGLFAPIWRNLQLFDVGDNPLRCDCRIKWILQQPFPKYKFHGECAEPKELKERNLKTLEHLDLWCF